MVHVRVPSIDKFLKPRALQKQFGELSGFCPPQGLKGSTMPLEEIEKYVSSSGSNRIFTIDMGDSDFGSRANMGRGHDYGALERGCATSFDAFFSRLSNIAVNRLNDEFSKAVCVLGSVDYTDLVKRCRGLDANVPDQRRVLIDSVTEVATRGIATMKMVMCSAGEDSKVFLVNGDHDHMTTAVGGFFEATGAQPVVVYLDIHADSRPAEDGPHSGTWCCEMFDKGWVRHAYCVGLNPLSNSGATLENMDTRGVKYEPYVWDYIKSGEMSLTQCADDVISSIHATVKPGDGIPPVILSICGDSVLGLPASAGTGTVGYSTDAVYSFIARICKNLPVTCLTVAELKTSLAPHNASLVGEFLTQVLYLFQRCVRTPKDR